LATAHGKRNFFVEAFLVSDESFEAGEVEYKWTVDDLHAIGNRLLLRLGPVDVVTALRQVIRALRSQGRAMTDHLQARGRAVLGERKSAEHIDAEMARGTSQAPSLDTARETFQKTDEASIAALNEYLHKAREVVRQKIAEVERHP
jgi:hypothetical protein